MSDAEIDVEMPEVPQPNTDPEDPLEDQEYDAVDDPGSEDEESDALPTPKLEVKEIVPDGDVFLNAKHQAPPKKAKVRKPPSEKQLAHLKKIRVKALEARKAKQSQKVKPQKKNKIDSYQPGAEEYEVQDEKPIKGNGSLVHLTQDELRQLQYEAIYGYDTMRKARKEKKRNTQAKEQAEKKAYQAVAKAVQPHDNDGWGVCFQ